MLITHNCTVCRTGHIVYSMNESNLYTCKCGHAETDEDFWRIYRYEGYCSWLESQIEDGYPFKSISILGSTIDLTVGWHVLGKNEARDYCVNSILESARKIFETWQICYRDFDRFERRIVKFENVSDEDKKYSSNVESARAFFADLPSKMKEQYK